VSAKDTTGLFVRTLLQSRLVTIRAADWALSGTNGAGELQSLPVAISRLSEWAVPGSNQRPPACKAGALPAELTALRN
jgi:hypothetical protein